MTMYDNVQQYMYHIEQQDVVYVQNHNDRKLFYPGWEIFFTKLVLIVYHLSAVRGYPCTKTEPQTIGSYMYRY